MDEGLLVGADLQPSPHAGRKTTKRLGVLIREALLVAFDEGRRTHFDVECEFLAQTLKGPLEFSDRWIIPSRCVEGCEVPHGRFDLCVASTSNLVALLRRREVFATSGPRMTVRFFGGWDDFATNDESDTAWCDRPDALEGAYASGVPMGGQLSETGQQESAPFFAMRAQRDAGTAEHPGGLLQRLQIIKVQATKDGNFHQQVFDVAGGPTDAGVHSGSCVPHGPGANSLCAVWQDPDFDPKESAAYYVRAIENPSCRWTTWSCLTLPEKDRPPLCFDLNEAKLTQERIWSSPIWYQQHSE